MEENIIKQLNKVLEKTNKKYDNPEPMIKKASELKKMVPVEYKEMLKIKPKEELFYWQSDYINSLFYAQGKFMEKFSDHYVYYGETRRYLPQYAEMSIPELRGYFTWRTNVRRGVIEKTNLSFVFLYSYELINGIGVLSVQNGYHKLLKIWKEYRKYDGMIDRYLVEWLKDYIIYYEMDRDLIKNIKNNKSDFVFILEDMKQEIENNQFKVVLERLNSYSSYKILDSKFFNLYKEDYTEVFKDVFHNITFYFEKYREISFFDTLFGNESYSHWVPFRSGIFYENHKKKFRECRINDFERYVCENGEWGKYAYLEYNCNRRLIGEILKTTEFFMRQFYNFSYKIAMKSSSMVITEVIENTVKSYCEINDRIDCYQRKKKKKVKKKKKKKEQLMVYEEKPLIVDIDRKKIAKIRKESQKIQEKLIIEEIKDEQKEKEIIVLEKPIKIDQSQSDMNNFIKYLNSEERDLLKAMLEIQPNEKLIVEKFNNMLSIMIESINEKALDYIEDNLIEIKNENPWIYDEYRQELQEVLE